MGEILRPNFTSSPEHSPLLIDGSLALAAHSSSGNLDNSVVLFEARRKSALQEQVDYFDQNYITEELPRDWWNISDVGFSMKAQMRLLTETGDKNSWVDQVDRDFRGFALEYLRQGTFFPVEYAIINGELVDTRYGNRRLLDTVDSNERSGVVRVSVSKIQEYLIDGEDGAIAVMVSPPGWTGLAMDNGKKVEYEDTQTYYLQKKGDKVLGGGFRTDFNLPEARALIKKLTGEDLPASASIIDCVKAIATISPNTEGIQSASDLINLLKKVKKESRPGEASFAYQDKTWEDMERDIGRRQELYEFDKKTGEIINEFKNYVLSDEHSELEIQKALATTFLRLSKYFLVDKKIHLSKIDTETYHPKAIDAMREMTYGQVVGEVQKIPGCAGGGSSATSVTSITERLALSPDKYGVRTFECPECHKTNIRPKDQLLSECQHCGSNKVCAPTSESEVARKAA